MSPVKTIRRALVSRQRQNEQRSIPRPPSPRDLEIFNRVVANCEPQKKIAAELHLHPSRISQILRRVRAWHSRPLAPQGPASNGAGVSPAAQDIQADTPASDLSSTADPHTPRSAFRVPYSSPLSLAILIARNENIYALLMREYHRQEASPQLTTTRTEAKPIAPTNDNTSSNLQSQISNLQSKFSDSQSQIPNPQSEICPPTLPPLQITKQTTTVRDQPPSLQLLKAAHRSLQELHKLNELEHAPDVVSPPPPLSPSPPPHSALRNLNLSDPATLDAIHSLLAELRDKAEDAGRVPKSTNSYQLLKNLLSAYLGLDQGPGGGGFLQLDDAIRHFLKTFLISPANVIPRDPEPEQLLSDILARRASEGFPLPLGEGAERSEAGVGVPAYCAVHERRETPFPDPQPLTFPQLERADFSSPDTASSSTDLPLTPTPNATSTTPPDPATTPKPAPAPRKKSPAPAPQPSTSNPQNLPFLSPITDAQYNALFHPWVREY